MHDWAGQRASDPVDRLHLRHNELAELVHAAGLAADDHVVRAGYVLRQCDALDVGDLTGDLRGLADFRLHEDVCLDNHGRSSHGMLVGPGRPYRLHAGKQASQMQETVGSLGEFGLIEALTERFPSTVNVLLGPGDDAAVLRAPDRRVVATTDVLIEDVHFRREWSSAHDVGRKAAAQSMADVVAMGAHPTALLVGVALPPDLESAWPLALADGLAEQCAALGAAVVGGDVVRGEHITVAVTALGDLSGRPPVTRAGASPGDIVAVAGRLGRAAAGLALLRRGRDRPVAAIAAHRCPSPPYTTALAATDLTAMIDVSDGLLQDLGHIATASGVAIEIESSRLPVDDVVGDAARQLGVSPRQWVLAGGEDHAFAACFSAAPPAGWQAVGEVRSGAGVTLDGARPPNTAGFDHFRTL